MGGYQKDSPSSDREMCEALVNIKMTPLSPKNMVNFITRNQLLCLLFNSGTTLHFSHADNTRHKDGIQWPFASLQV